MIRMLILLLWVGSLQAAEVDPERMRALEEELRCLVCQNQSIADSQAPLAQDLREELQRLMREGRSDDEIRAWMVERYGDFVLYRPPFKPTTWALWLGPLFLVGLGGLLVWRVTRKPATAAESPVDPKTLQALLNDKDQA